MQEVDSRDNEYEDCFISEMSKTIDIRHNRKLAKNGYTVSVATDGLMHGVPVTVCILFVLIVHQMSVWLWRLIILILKYHSTPSFFDFLSVSKKIIRFLLQLFQKILLNYFLCSCHFNFLLKNNILINYSVPN